MAFDDYSIEYRFANASSLCQNIRPWNDQKRNEILINILGKNISFSEEDYTIDPNNLNEEKIREIVSDSIDYYLGRYLNSSTIINHKNENVELTYM